MRQMFPHLVASVNMVYDVFYSQIVSFSVVLLGVFSFMGSGFGFWVWKAFLLT